MERTGRADGLRTRETILNAAVALIAEGGVPAATQRKVAQRAGVSLASTTYHFPAARDLVSAALEHAAARYMRRLTELRDETLDKRTTFVEASLASMRDDDGQVIDYAFVSYELLIESARNPDMRSQAEKLITSLEAFCAPWVGAARARGAAAAALGLVLFDLASAHHETTPVAISETFGLFGLADVVRLSPGSPAPETHAPAES
jgi:DNA-binding transcriptional regulator YbjK